MPIARALATLTAALAFLAWVPTTATPSDAVFGPGAELTAIETLELLDLSQRVEAALDARDALTIAVPTAPHQRVTAQ